MLYVPCDINKYLLLYTPFPWTISQGFLLNQVLRILVTADLGKVLHLNLLNNHIIKHKKLKINLVRAQVQVRGTSEYSFRDDH